MRQPAKEIKKKQFVFNNGGTTNLAAARIIPERLSTTVASQYPAIAATLATRQGHHINHDRWTIRPYLGSSVGAEATRQLRHGRIALRLQTDPSGRSRPPPQ